MVVVFSIVLILAGATATWHGATGQGYRPNPNATLMHRQFGLADSPAADGTADALGRGEFVGSLDLGKAFGENFKERGFPDLPLGGISGIAAIRQQAGRYVLLSDYRGDKGSARALLAELKFDPKTGAPVEASVEKPLDLTEKGGNRYPGGTVDPESIRSLPGGRFAWSSEGAVFSQTPPSIQISGEDGKELSRIDAPPHHRPRVLPPRGIEPNQGYEGLAVSNDGRRATTVLESTLMQDGLSASWLSGTRSRITTFDLGSGRPISEYVYPIDRIPPFSGLHRGISDIVALPDGSWITVERTYRPFQDLGVRIFHVSPACADDVLGRPNLSGNEVAVSKTLLYDFADAPDGTAAGNVEGLTLGPLRRDGRRMLLAVTDNNFYANKSTQVHAIALPKGLGTR